MIDRVHGNAADGWPDSPPALRACLAELAEVVLLATHLTDRGATLDVHLAHLAGTQTHRGVGAITGDDLHAAACGTRNLRTLARLQLDGMHQRTDRDIPQGQGVAQS